MLRHVLDAAAAGVAAEEEDSVLLPDSENTSIAQDSESSSVRPRRRSGYGSTTSASRASQETSNENDYEEDDDDDDSDSSSVVSADLSQEPEVSFMQRCCAGIRGCFATIADVDNLWDESEGHITRKNRLLVLFWFFLLAIAYAGERSTFYLLVDRTGSFRLFSSLMVTSCHALLLAFAMMLSAMQRRDFSFKSLGLPIVDVGLMAILDMSALVLAFVTGYHVPPTLTVILVQWTIPLTVFFSQFTHPDGKCRGVCGRSDNNEAGGEQESETLLELDPEIDETTLAAFNTPPLPGWGGYAKAHLWGSCLITFAVFLGLTPAFITFYDPSIFSYADRYPLRTAINSIVFALACVPSAASQLYKEHVFTQQKKPIDPTLLNMILSAFQFVFILLVSPLIYTLQGMGTPGQWTELYPSTECSKNFVDGLRCYFGRLDDNVAENGYAEPAHCKFSLLIVLFHVSSIILVGVSVDKIVNAGATKIMFRGISAGIILALMCLLVYDFYDEDFNYGFSVDILHCVCTAFLILGSEVYHRVTVQDVVFETTYPDCEVVYDEDA